MTIFVKENVFRAVWSRGQGMSPEKAVRYALGVEQA